MSESLQQYQTRTAWMRTSLPHDALTTAPGLPSKVAPNGRLLPFFGNTVIFDLSPADKAWLTALQTRLYQQCGDVLAHPLAPHTFHITLHDLLAAPHAADVSGRMPAVAQHARTVLGDVRAFLPETVHVRPVCLCSMAGTSVVVGFEPSTEADCQALMTSWEAFQDVVPLPYALTLHATLAYYRPGTITGDALSRLHGCIAEATLPPEAALSRDALYLADFLSMNDYRFHP